MASPATFTTRDKPSGIPSHRPDDLGFGFIELLASRENCRVFGGHRLDKDTSGTFLIATNQEDTIALGRLFTDGKANKVYLLLSGRGKTGSRHSMPGTSVHYSSNILRQGSGWQSTPNSANPNATTTFTYLQPVGPFHLWQAEPLTGKTHQIRLHAADLGIPILGDPQYGGGEFPALCLHALAIEIDGQRFESPPPAWFSDPGMMDTQLGAALALGLDRRKRAFALEGRSSCRILHRELAWLTADKLGEIMWYSWYRDTRPEASELDILSKHTEQLGCAGWYLVAMANRGQGADENSRLLLSSGPELPESWVVEETGRLFECRSHHGWSAGLFLDQRLNRSWLERVAAGKRVLNLFSYSGGFTVAALRGGAVQIVAVDSSQVAHEWSRVNVRLNELDEAAVTYWSGDARDYCAKATRKGELFDLIILDPPTFARGKKRPLSLPKEWLRLVTDNLALLAPGGQLLFCTNYEKLTLAQILKSLKDKFAYDQGHPWVLEHRFPDLDFLVGETQGKVALKSVIVCRNGEG